MYIVKDTGPKSLSHLKFPMRVVDLLENHLDIMGTPRRYFFKLLSYFANAEHEKERLEYFYTSEAQVIFIVLEFRIILNNI